MPDNAPLFRDMSVVERPRMRPPTPPAHREGLHPVRVRLAKVGAEGSSFILHHRHRYPLQIAAAKSFKKAA